VPNFDREAPVFTQAAYRPEDCSKIFKIVPIKVGATTRMPLNIKHYIFIHMASLTSHHHARPLSLSLGFTKSEPYICGARHDQSH
jgi:hypothetical protein